MEKPTYEQAVEAKRILLEYIGDIDYIETKREKKEVILYFALTQEYFLD